MHEHTMNEVVAVGIIRQDGEGKMTHVDQSMLNQLPTGTILFVQRAAPAGEGLLQEVVAIQSLQSLKFNPSVADVIATTKLASAVITASRRKLDLAMGAIEILRDALAASETARKVGNTTLEVIQMQLDESRKESAADAAEVAFWRARFPHALKIPFDGKRSGETVGDRIEAIRERAKAEV